MGLDEKKKKGLALIEALSKSKFFKNLIINADEREVHDIKLSPIIVN